MANTDYCGSKPSDGVAKSLPLKGTGDAKLTGNGQKGPAWTGDTGSKVPSKTGNFGGDKS